jgi:hypothetical protein
VYDRQHAPFVAAADLLLCDDSAYQVPGRALRHSPSAGRHIGCASKSRSPTLAGKVLRVACAHGQARQPIAPRTARVLHDGGKFLFYETT